MPPSWRPSNPVGRQEERYSPTDLIGFWVSVRLEMCGVLMLRRVGMDPIGYRLDENTVVLFELDPTAGFVPAGRGDEVVGALREAAGPVIEGAKAVLEKAKEGGVHQIEVKFGIRVSGTMNWVIAKAATDANFEVTMAWKLREDDSTSQNED